MGREVFEDDVQLTERRLGGHHLAQKATNSSRVCRGAVVPITTYAASGGVIRFDYK